MRSPNYLLTNQTFFLIVSLPLLTAFSYGTICFLIDSCVQFTPIFREKCWASSGYGASLDCGGLREALYYQTVGGNSFFLLSAKKNKIGSYVVLGAKFSLKLIVLLSFFLPINRIRCKTSFSGKKKSTQQYIYSLLFYSCWIGWQLDKSTS